MKDMEDKIEELLEELDMIASNNGTNSDFGLPEAEDDKLRAAVRQFVVQILDDVLDHLEDHVDDYWWIEGHFKTYKQLKGLTNG